MASDDDAGGTAGQDGQGGQQGGGQQGGGAAHAAAGAANEPFLTIPKPGEGGQQGGVDSGGDGGGDSGGDGGGEGGQDGGGQQQAGETARLTIGEGEVEVPKAVADHVAALTERLAAFENPEVPEDYAITVPEELKAQGFEADPEDPLFKAIAPALKDLKLTQAQFDALAAPYIAHKAQEAQAAATEAAAERKAFIEAFAPAELKGADSEEALAAAKKNAQPLADWAAGLLGPALLKEPKLGAMLQDLATLNDGVMLLKAIRDAVGERGPAGRSGGEGGGAPPKPVEEILYGRTTPGARAA